MGNRQQTSSALTNRAKHVNIPQYERSEMLAILMHKGLSDLQADAAVTAYENINNTRDKPLNFRDLMRLAEKINSPKEKQDSMFGATVSDENLEATASAVAGGGAGK